MNPPRYYIGIGCRSGCSETVLLELIEQTLISHAVPLKSISAIASIDSKRMEAGLQAVAATLKLPLLFFSAQELNRFANRVDATSPIVLRETGVANIAETSALALAELCTGKIAELIIRKHKNTAATFALAGAIHQNTSNKI